MNFNPFYLLVTELSLLKSKIIFHDVGMKAWPSFVYQFICVLIYLCYLWANRVDVAPNGSKIQGWLVFINIYALFRIFFTDFWKISS